MYAGYSGEYGASVGSHESPLDKMVYNITSPGDDTDGFLTNLADGSASRTRSRIFVCGPKRSGKSSIQQVVFQKRSPNSTLFMPETSTLEIHHVQNNAFVNLEVWDFPGDFTLNDNAALSEGKMLTDDAIFEHCGALVYVVDMKTYETSPIVIDTLVEWLSRSHAVNPKIHFAVLLHKFDAEQQSSDFAKSDIIDEIEKRVQDAFDASHIADEYDSMSINYHLTSIYDHTLFELFSQIVQTLFEEHSVLEELLNTLVEKCDMDKAFLFDVASKIYIAENPPALVDSDRYELSADMIDVVIDVLCIYGSEDGDGEDGFGFDSKASSIIHLAGPRHGGDVLYLRQVSSELAVVCILREDNFKNKGLVDHNIEVFKTFLHSIVQLKDTPSSPTPLSQISTKKKEYS